MYKHIFKVQGKCYCFYLKVTPHDTFNLFIWKWYKHFSKPYKSAFLRFLKDVPFSLLWPLLYVPCAAHLSDAYKPVMDVCVRQACLTCLKSLKWKFSTVCITVHHEPNRKCTHILKMKLSLTSFQSL